MRQPLALTNHQLNAPYTQTFQTVFALFFFVSFSTRKRKRESEKMRGKKGGVEFGTQKFSIKTTGKIERKKNKGSKGE